MGSPVTGSAALSPASAKAGHPSVSIILPTYNERENISIFIGQLTEAFGGYPYEIIVVDDSSPDGTGGLVKKLSGKNPAIRLLTRTAKEGIGAALREGYNAARNTIIVSSDVDLSFQAADLVRLVEAVNKGSDLALGSRHSRGSFYEAPNAAIRRKRFISHAGNVVIRLFFGLPLHDFSANCRAIRRNVWERINTTENTNTLLLEMILRCYYQGLRVTELPVGFFDRRFGASKLRLSKEAPKFLLKILKYQIQYFGKRPRCR